MAFPSFYYFISGGVLPHERGRAVALMLLGVHVGTTIALLGSPRLLAASGWPSIFHVFGGAELLGVAVWERYARDALPGGEAAAKGGATKEVTPVGGGEVWGGGRPCP